MVIPQLRWACTLGHPELPVFSPELFPFPIGKKTLKASQTTLLGIPRVKLPKPEAQEISTVHGKHSPSEILFADFITNQFMTEMMQCQGSINESEPTYVFQW